MGKNVLSLLTICLFFLYPLCHARMPVQASDSQPGIRDNALYISNNLTTKTNTKDFTRTGIVIQSLALPGLGLSRVTGNPHWLRGVAGYGCIAGSIVLNRQAVSTFNTIEGLKNVDDVNEAFDKSVRQDNISEVLAYAAIGIWVADIIWTVAGTSDLRKRRLESQSKGFSIKSNFDTVSNIPMVSLRYRF